MFFPFIEDKDVQLLGVEAGGRSERPGDHAATLSYGRPGVLHGMYTYVLQDDDGQTSPVHSISAGLDYPGVGPEHSSWKDSDRVSTPTPRTTRSWRPSTSWPAPKDHPSLGSSTHWPRPCRWPQRSPDGSSSSASPAAAAKRPRGGGLREVFEKNDDVESQMTKE